MRLTDEEYERLSRKEILAAVTLQRLDREIKAFKAQFRWKEARAALNKMLRRNTQNGRNR